MPGSERAHEKTAAVLAAAAILEQERCPTGAMVELASSNGCIGEGRLWSLSNRVSWCIGIRAGDLDHRRKHWMVSNSPSVKYYAALVVRQTPFPPVSPANAMKPSPTSISSASSSRGRSSHTRRLSPAAATETTNGETNDRRGVALMRMAFLLYGKSRQRMKRRRTRPIQDRYRPIRASSFYSAASNKGHRTCGALSPNHIEPTS